MIWPSLPFTQIIAAVLLLAGFCFAVFFHGSDDILYAPIVVCLLGFAALSLWPNFKNGWNLPATATVLFGILFFLWLFAAQFWATTPYLSTFFTIIIGTLPVLFLVLVLGPEPEKRVRFYAVVPGIAIAVLSVSALIQFFFFYEKYGPRIHDPMLNPNNLAGLFNMALFPAIGFFFVAKDRKKLALAGFLMALFYAALLVTQSRGAFLACMICVLVFLPSALAHKPFPWKKLAVFAAIALFMPVLVNFVGTSALNENLFNDLGGMVELHSVLDRLLLWETTWHMVQDNFWLGTGLGSFYYYYPNYRDPADLSDGFFAHMDPLQFWAETGVMAPVLFYGVLICVLLRTGKAVRAARGNYALKIEIMATFSAMLTLAGHTHITFHLYMPGMIIPLACLLAWWYVATEKALGNQEQRKIFKPKKPLRYGIALTAFICAGLVGGWALRGTMATYHMEKVIADVNEGNMPRAWQKLAKVKFWSTPHYDRYYEYEARFRISLLTDNAKNLSPQAAQRLYDEAKYFLDKAEDLNPAYTRIWDLRARMYMSVNGIIVSNGNKKAELLFKRVLKANPLAVDARVALAGIYQRQNNLPAALAVLEEGTRWPAVKGQKDIDFLVALAGVRLAMGDKAIHDRIIEMARQRAIGYGLVN